MQFHFERDQMSQMRWGNTHYPIIAAEGQCNQSLVTRIVTFTARAAIVLKMGQVLKKRTMPVLEIIAEAMAS
jgi:hypothetical protein